MKIEIKKEFVLPLLFVLIFTEIGFSKKKPAISLESEPLFISPNKDGVQDEIAFKIQATNLKAVTSWEVQIKDPSDSVRKTVSGLKKLPSSLFWDGKDDFGAVCSEGKYEVSLRVWDEDNHEIPVLPLQVVVDMTPPTLSLTTPLKTIMLPDATLQQGLIPAVTFYFSAVDLSGIANWKLQLLDGNKREFYSEISTAPLPPSWILSGEKFTLPLGKVTALFSTTDRAGNRGSAPPVELEIVAESEKSSAPTPPQIEPEQKKLPSDQNKTHAFLQLTTILSISDLFGKNADNHSALSPAASLLLDPLAKTILDLPGTKATILGHVDSTKKPKEEKALSSYFAWRVYSYFVKQKRVDKNALAVKGLGAEVPISENRTLLGRARNRRIEMQIFLPSQNAADQ